MAKEKLPIDPDEVLPPPTEAGRACPENLIAIIGKSLDIECQVSRAPINTLEVLAPYISQLGRIGKDTCLLDLGIAYVDGRYVDLTHVDPKTLQPVDLENSPANEIVRRAQARHEALNPSAATKQEFVADHGLDDAALLATLTKLGIIPMANVPGIYVRIEYSNDGGPTLSYLDIHALEIALRQTAYQRFLPQLPQLWGN